MVNFLNSSLGAALILAFALAGMATLTCLSIKWSRENRAQAAARSTEQRYWEWYHASYRHVEVPAFLRKPHPKHLDTQA